MTKARDLSIGIPGGLVLITPTGATGGTVNPNGTVTVGNAVTSVTVTGAFSATYDGYRIVMSGGVASGALVEIYLTLGGIASGYQSNIVYGTYASNGAAQAVNSLGGFWNYVGGGNTAGAMADIDLWNPFLTRAKWGKASFQQFQIGNIGHTTFMNTSTTSATEFTLGAIAATLTGGQIAVYGYRK